MFLVLIDLTFVFVPVAELNHGTLRRHGVVQEGAVVSSLISKDHLAQALEGIIMELTHVVKGRLEWIGEEITTSALHFVLAEVAFVDVSVLESRHAPSIPFIVLPVTFVLLILVCELLTFPHCVFRTHLRILQYHL